jgi:hypothetical protein
MCGASIPGFTVSVGLSYGEQFRSPDIAAAVICDRRHTPLMLLNHIAYVGEVPQPIYRGRQKLSRGTHGTRHGRRSSAVAP